MISDQALSFLKQSGFNLVATFECKELTADLQAQLKNESVDISRYPWLILLGNGGGAIWPLVQKLKAKSDHPFDDYSAHIASQLIDKYLGSAPSQLLYPGHTEISLMRLGELAGWSHPSPLGLGIHPEYGLWFAYRAALVTSAMLDPTSPIVSAPPCESCIDKPCISACPVNAVKSQTTFDISSCYEFRVSENSPCATQCYSRFACPVGTEYQYPLAQVQHHYDLGRRVSE